MATRGHVHLSRASRRPLQSWDMLMYPKEQQPCGITHLQRLKSAPGSQRSLPNQALWKYGEGQPHENKRWLYTQSLLQTGSQPQSLCFGKVSGMAGQGVGECPSGEKERLEGVLIGVPLACGSWGWANQK